MCCRSIENVYKRYTESFKGSDDLRRIQEEALAVIPNVFREDQTQDFRTDRTGPVGHSSLAPQHPPCTPHVGQYSTDSAERRAYSCDRPTLTAGLER